MEPSNTIRKWINRNWAFVMTCAILAVGVAVLLMRSNEYTQYPVEAAVIAPQPTAAVVAGEATVIKPSKAKPELVSDTTSIQ